MKKQTESKSKPKPARNLEQNRRRTQQIIFSVLAVLIILSWIISLVAIPGL